MAGGRTRCVQHPPAPLLTSRVRPSPLPQDKEVAKKQLRLQDLTYKLKIETARTAASVTLSNKMVEIEHNIDKLVEKRVTAFADDSGAALSDANRRREELEEKVRTLTVHSKSTDDANKITSKLLKQVLLHARTPPRLPPPRG